MSIETTMLLTTTTALQGWFEARGQAVARGGQDTLGISDASFHESPEGGEVTSLVGRLLSTMPYLAAPTLISIFSTMLANPYWIPGAILVANVVPSAIFLLCEDKDSSEATLAKNASQIMGLAMKVLNVVMIGMVIGSSATSMGAVALGATTLMGAISVASLIYTTMQSMPSASAYNNGF